MSCGCSAPRVVVWRWSSSAVHLACPALPAHTLVLTALGAEAPKGLGGTTLPAKKGKKAAAGGDATGESAGGAGSSEAKPPKEKAPMVSVAAKPLEVSG